MLQLQKLSIKGNFAYFLLMSTALIGRLNHMVSTFSFALKVFSLLLSKASRLISTSAIVSPVVNASDSERITPFSAITLCPEYTKSVLDSPIPVFEYIYADTSLLD